MLTARSILSLWATRTATQCSAALPTIATTITPMKNSLRPTDSEASEIEPTRISDIRPTASAGDRQHRDRAAYAPAESGLLLVLVHGVEQVAVRLQREEQPGDVGGDQDDRDGEREVLDGRVVVDDLVGRRRAGPCLRPARRSPASAARRRRATASSTARWRRCESNFWRSRRAGPPTSIAAPSTSRMLPRIEPMIEALTTSCRPSLSANRAMISSGALPKVTLSRPPMPGPERAASSSVARPISAAVGMIPSAATTKISPAEACASSSTTASGMNGASRYGQPCAENRNATRFPGVAGRRRPRAEPTSWR